MTDHEGAADELAAMIMAGGNWVVTLVRETVRLAVLVVLVLAAVGALFVAWGVVVGWD